uniref:Platelet-derived growth factor (PDGF) family profile domain-containing protein n=1 Tax=Spermophilus dauricus TaxID=99837 RepID=A0A8C9QAB1_SPEDA
APLVRRTPAGLRLMASGSAQPSSPSPAPPAGLTHPPAFVVIPFHEVWGRSYCRALEKLVDIVTEYPSEMEYILSPSCVSLKRCTGCCGDEDLHCLPVETTNVTMQILKIPPEGPPSYVELKFSQHVSCECSHIPGRQSWDMPGDHAACVHLPSPPSLTAPGAALAGSNHCPCPWFRPSITILEEIPRMHPGRKGRKLKEKVKKQRVDSKDPRFDAKRLRHANEEP